MHTRTIFLAAAAFLAVAAPVHAQTFTWDGGAGSGSWAAPANWNPDGAPTPGAGVTIVLDGITQTITNQDIATPFQLNQLHQQANAATGFVVNGNRLQFAGAGAIIDNFVGQTLRINAPVEFSAATTINHQASFGAGAEVVLAGPLTGSGNVTTATGSPGTVTTLAGLNNTGFTGTWTAGSSSVTQIAAHNALFRTTVNVGNLSAGVQTGTTVLGSGAAFGDAGFNLQLGSIAVAAGGQFAVGTPASASTVLAGFNNGSTTFGGTAAASFAMENAGSHFGKVGTGTTTFTANNSTVAGSFSVRAGQVTISGASGAITNGANPQGFITIYPGATMLLDNTAALNQNRLGNSVSVGLTGGTLRLNGNNGATAGSEQITNLVFGSGQSVVEVNPTAARGVRLAISGQLFSNPTATVFFRGAGLGSADFNQAAQIGNITVTGIIPPTLVGNILPYAIASEGNGATPDTFVTHGANGFRPLIATDYVAFAAAGAGDNVSDGGFTVAPNRTINALRLTGTATLNNNLTLAAGALTNRTGGSSITGAGTLIFGTGGTSTAYISNGVDMTISAPVQAAHLAKSGPGVLTVSNVALGNGGFAAVNTGTLALAVGPGITAANGILTYQVSRGATLDATLTGITLGTDDTLRGSGAVLGPVLVGSGSTITPSALSGPDATLASPGILTVDQMVFAPGGTYRVYMNSAFGGPYTSSLITSANSLDLSGLSAGNTFIVRPDSLALSNTDGAVYDFVSSQSFSWTIATFGGGITGFSPDKFTINTADFANALDGGVFSISQSGNDLVLTFTPIPEPAYLLLATAAAGFAARALRRRGRSVNVPATAA